MIEMSMEKHFDLRRIRLDLHRELNAGIKFIANDIRAGMLRGDQFGMKFKPNADSTVEAKKRKKSKYNQPLMETGLMARIGEMVMPQEAKSNYQVSTLAPNEDRVDIAFWNDQGTMTIPARLFWGISEKAEKHILDIIYVKIESEIRKA